LILSGNTLYGTTAGGGPNHTGTVFAVNTNGADYTVLYSFTALVTDNDPNSPIYGFSTNSDGAGPNGLVLSGNTLYGTAGFIGGTSGPNGSGTVFAVNTDGTGFTVLHTFTAVSGYGLSGTNSDGASPVAGLVLSGNTLYGTAYLGGSSGNGTVFAVKTDGTGFTTLYSFTGGSDGANPDASLILSGNTLYGTTPSTVFSIFIQPQLTLTPSGPYVILAWPTNYSGFTLQSTTNLGSAAVWSTNSSTPVVIGGDNVVINAASGKQQFFRLSQ